MPVEPGYDKADWVIQDTGTYRLSLQGQVAMVQTYAVLGLIQMEKA